MVDLQMSLTEKINEKIDYNVCSGEKRRQNTTQAALATDATAVSTLRRRDKKRTCVFMVC